LLPGNKHNENISTVNILKSGAVKLMC